MADEQQWINELSVGHPMLDQLIRSNGDRIGHLGQRFGAGPDMARLMIQHLINTIYPELADRQAYELDFQRYLATKLAEIEGRLEELAAAQEQAQQIATPPTGLFVPGQG
jgi:hypothetical protein